MVDQAKAAFQNLKKCFSKKNELKKSNKSQINQIFTRRIKSYLKKDSLSARFIFCIKLLNAPFSSCLRNNSRTHSFIFLLLQNKMSFPSGSEEMSKELQNSDLIYVNLMTDVFKIIVKYRRKIIAKYRHLSPSGNWALATVSLLLSKLAMRLSRNN